MRFFVASACWQSKIVRYHISGSILLHTTPQQQSVLSSCITNLWGRTLYSTMALLDTCRQNQVRALPSRLVLCLVPSLVLCHALCIPETLVTHTYWAFLRCGLSSPTRCRLFVLSAFSWFLHLPEFWRKRIRHHTSIYSFVQFIYMSCQSLDKTQTMRRWQTSYLCPNQKPLSPSSWVTLGIQSNKPRVENPDGVAALCNGQ